MLNLAEQGWILSAEPSTKVQTLVRDLSSLLNPRLDVTSFHGCAPLTFGDVGVGAKAKVLVRFAERFIIWGGLAVALLVCNVLPFNNNKIVRQDMDTLTTLTSPRRDPATFWLWWIECNRTALSCFLLSRSTVFMKVSPTEPEDSPVSSFKAILCFASRIRIIVRRV